MVDLSAAWTAGHFTSCTTYDTATTADLPVTQTNALGQASSTAYDYTSGALPTSMTDANGQVSSDSVSYDSNGNETISVKQPGETGAYTTRQSEATSCTSSSTLPCYEIDTNSSLYPNAISRTYYDQQGRAIETRTPGPTPGDDTVVETVYNDQNHTMWKSVPFQVADGSGWLDPTTTKDINGNAPAGTTTFYDALNRVIATQDPNFGSAQEPGLACSTALSGKYTTCTNYSWGQAAGDSNQYEITTSVDANGHVTESFADTAGNVRYTQTYSGVYGGTLTVQQQKQVQYNALNKPTSVSVVDEQPQSGESPTGTAATMTYDDMGRMLSMWDPDQGQFTYTYDPDGRVLSIVQTANSVSRTLGFNYDLLGRAGCEQDAAPTINWNGACSAGHSLIQNTYDTTFLGIQGTSDFPVGHLTQSVATTYYPDGTAATATDQFQTSARGQTVAAQLQMTLPSSWNVGSALPAYQMAQAYNDANQPTTTTLNNVGASYSFTQVYDPNDGSLQGLSNNGNSTANLATLAYNEYAQLGSLTLLNGAVSSPASLASETFNYDGDLRPNSLTASWLPGSGNSGQILSNSRTYDNAGNVTSVGTTMAAVPGQIGSGGTETQNFCYNEQNELLWAGNGGTQPGAGNGTCGSGTLNNSFSNAGYTNTYSYTNLGQMWQGPLNGKGNAVQYLYCNSGAPHHLTNIYPLGATCATESNYTAIATFTHGNWGDETSEVYNGVTTTFSYDALNHLVEWQGPNSASEFTVYDASGERVLTRAVTSASTSITVYAFGLQELSYTGSGTLTGQTDYYSVAGHLVGSSNGTTTTSYLTDPEGSLLSSLSSSAITGEQLYTPYGSTRYQVGSLGTAKAYTGQEADPLTGLYYYHARYYDPVIGQFLSPDNKQGNAQGMNPYEYVAGNPETLTDPTGQKYTCGNGGCGGSKPTCNDNPALPGCTEGPPSPGQCKQYPTMYGCPTSTGNGGGSHHGGGPDSSLGPKKPKTRCDAICRAREQRAYQDAEADRNAFQSFADALSSLPYIIATILGNLLSFIPFIGPIWGGIIAGILNGLALLGRLAGDIAKGFKQETDQEDLRSGQGLGYFTADNLEAQGQQILGVVGLEGKESVVVGWATIITSIAAGNGIAAWGPKLVSQAKNLLVGGVTTGIVTAIVSAAGSMVMSNMVSSDIAQEVSDAS